MPQVVIPARPILYVAPFCVGTPSGRNFHFGRCAVMKIAVMACRGCLQILAFKLLFSWTAVF
jgi:hypothetical protein